MAGAGMDILDAATRTDWQRHLVVLLGAAAVLAATTQGPLSTVVLVIELTR